MTDPRAPSGAGLRQPTTATVALFLFGSGLAALVYQTAWQRMLRPSFGASTAASAAVLGIFLGGLGLGGIWLGRRAELHARPLYFYGNLEVGVAFAAAITPLSVHACDALYVALGGSTALGSLGATAVRLLLAAVVLGPPVVLMGGTLPAAARAIESSDDAARGRLATLYAVNTAGAVAGALLSTFVLFEVFGTRLALYSAVLVNLLVAIIARARGRVAPEVPLATDRTHGASEASGGAGGTEAPPVGERERAPVPDSVPSRIVYATAAIVGFAFLYLELVWYRMLAPILGGSTFTFGLVLAVALAGIGIGGFMYSRRRESEPATLGLLATTVALEALAVGVPLWLGDSIALYAAYTRGIGALGFGALAFAWTTICAIVVLPAAIVSGYQFPVLFALLGRGRDGVAGHVGLAYAWNTVGSIAGSLLAGFWLIPALGAVGSWRAVVLLLAALAVVLSALGMRRSRAPTFAEAFAFVCVVLAVLTARAEGPTAVWRHSGIGAGRAALSSFARNDVVAWKREVNERFVWQADGVESSIALAASEGYAFVVNGKTDGSVVSDRGTQAMCGMLPALLHEAPKRFFVVGLGTGMTAGWASAIEGVERVDVAELEPGIVEIARRASLVNHAVLDQPNVRVMLGDGRELLRTNGDRYDVIVSEPSNPYRAGVASLFTSEFYEACRDHLAERGLFAQWVQGYEVDAWTMRVALRTMREVFPHVEMWQTQAGDFLLVASMSERVIDVGELRGRTAREPYRSALARTWLVEDAEGVLSHFVANRSLVEEIASAVEVPVNTDDENVLEYAFARTLGRDAFDGAMELTRTSMRRNATRPSVRGEVDWQRVDELRPRAWLIAGGTPPEDFPYATALARGRNLAVQAACIGRVDKIETTWSGEPRDVIERYTVALAAAQAGRVEAVEAASALGASGFVPEGELVLARYLATSSGRRPAMEAAARGIRALRSEALPLCDAAEQLLRMLETLAVDDRALAREGAETLLEGPLAIHRSNETLVQVRERLGFASRDTELCVRALGSHVEVPLWSKWLLTERHKCLVGAGHPLGDAAAEDLNVFIGATPGDFDLGLPNLAPLPAAPAPAVEKPSVDANPSASAAPTASAAP